MQIRNNSIVLCVTDDGKGFKRNNSEDVKTKSGLGLTGMTERVRMLNGTFDIDSNEGEGTRIEIQIPINRKT